MKVMYKKRIEIIVLRGCLKRITANLGYLVLRGGGTTFWFELPKINGNIYFSKINID